MVEENNNEEQWIYGYKAFFDGIVNQYNQQFEIGKIYIDANIDKNFGYHFCKNIEDIFVFPQFRKNVSIYEVCGGGIITSYSNDYYGIYDVYAAEKIKIIREISRDEIIAFFLSFNSNFCSERLLRFIQLFPLNEDEIKLFSKNFQKQDRVIRYINYYQKGDDDAFVRKLKKD